MKKKMIVLIVISGLSRILNAQMQDNNDLNLISGSSFIRTPSFSVVNTPENTVQLGLQSEFDVNYKWQFVNSFNTNNYYLRSYVGQWRNWYKIWHSGNLNRSDADFSAKNITIGSDGQIATIAGTANSGAIQIKTCSWASGYDTRYLRLGWQDNNGVFGAYLSIIDNGNIGIGNTNPQAKLDVNGAINICAPGENSPTHNLGYGLFPHSGVGLGLYSVAGGISFWGGSAPVEYMRIFNGNLLIGKTTQENPDYKLDVAGSIRANEIKVNMDGADFVFEPTYKLRPLAEVETFINQHKHLPDVAPAADMQTNGVSMGEMQAKLLQKVEELTLYSIEQEKKQQEQDKAKVEIKQKVEEQDKKLHEQEKKNSELQAKLAEQAKEIEQLKQLITQKLK